MQTNNELSDLMEKINRGVEKTGVHAVTQEEMKILYSAESSDAEKRMHVRNFALQNGFSVHIDFGLTVAVFHKPA